MEMVTCARRRKKVLDSPRACIVWVAEPRSRTYIDKRKGCIDERTNRQKKRISTVERRVYQYQGTMYLREYRASWRSEWEEATDM